jgi:hypothetical protein
MQKNKDRLYDPKTDGVLYMVRIDPEIASWIDHKAGMELVPPAVVIREILTEEYEHMASMEMPAKQEGES